MAIMAARTKQDRAFVVRPRNILLMSAPLRLARSSLPPPCPCAPGGHRRQMAGEGSTEGHILWGPLQLNGASSDGLISGKTNLGAGIAFSTFKFPTETRWQTIRLPARPRPIWGVRPRSIRHEMVKGFPLLFGRFICHCIRIILACEGEGYLQVFHSKELQHPTRGLRAARVSFT